MGAILDNRCIGNLCENHTNLVVSTPPYIEHVKLCNSVSCKRVLPRALVCTGLCCIY